MDCVFVAQGSEHLLEALQLPAETEVLLLPGELLNEALATETPQPMAALVEPPDWTWAHMLRRHRKTASLVVVLAGLQDPGKPGDDSALGGGVWGRGVVSLPGTVSAWNPKAVRASAGSVFRLPMIDGERGGVFYASARGGREDLDDHGAMAPSLPTGRPGRAGGAADRK